MNLSTKYKDEIRPKLASEFSGNPFSVPRLEKVVVDAGIGKIAEKKEEIGELANELARITGQKSQIRRANVAIAGFGIREGSIVGMRVTLRGARMYAFLDKLIKIVLPRLRDFRGLSVRSFDEQGNFSIGIVEHTIFPELSIGGKIARPFGLGITIVTNAKDKDKSKRLLEEIGMPFVKEDRG